MRKNLAAPINPRTLRLTNRDVQDDKWSSHCSTPKASVLSEKLGSRVDTPGKGCLQSPWTAIVALIFEKIGSPHLGGGRLLDTNGEGRYPTTLSVYPTVDIHCIRDFRARPFQHRVSASVRVARPECVRATEKDQIGSRAS
jgi:hypothetical protein